MFDDKKEPEDIFSGTDPLAGNQPPQSQPTQPQQPQMPTTQQSVPPQSPSMQRPTLESAMAAPARPASNRKLVVVAIIVVAIVLTLLAVLVGLWIVRSGEQSVPTNEQTTTPIIPPTGLDNESSITSPLDNEPEVEEATSPTQPRIPTEVDEPEEPIDTDNDGLTDEEESALGTSSNNPDTDNDGLNDSEEVRVWNTDPLNPDSDGDTFTDGAEVDNGYDPNQAGGVLLDVNV